MVRVAKKQEFLFCFFSFLVSLEETMLDEDFYMTHVNNKAKPNEGLLCWDGNDSKK